jgi:uncharacterized membrane protein YeaQ/YmgE (transglycosylase-associated protein family)
MAVTTSSTVRGPAFLRALLAGLAGGILAGIVGSIAAPLVMSATGVDASAILMPVSITMAATVGSLLGSVLWYFVAKRFSAVVFAAIAFAFVTLYSLWTAFGPPPELPGQTFPAGFAIPANVLHYIVGIVATAAIVLIAPRRRA